MISVYIVAKLGKDESLPFGEMQVFAKCVGLLYDAVKQIVNWEGSETQNRETKENSTKRGQLYAAKVAMH